MPLEPLVSVVIPCFNAERYVGEAIQSALSQSYQPVEVIVVDDGSEDSSVETARKFGSRVRVETGPHAGACAARNTGVAAARGDLIQFLDADDLLEPEKLGIQVPLMAGEEVDIVIGGWSTHPVGRPDLSQRCRIRSVPLDPVEFALFKIPLICNPIHWKRKFLEIGGFRADLPCAQDYDLLLRLACTDIRIAAVEEPLFVRRTVPGSISSDDLRMVRQFREVLWHSYRALEDGSRMSGSRRSAFAACMAGKARAMVRLGSEEEALSMFEDASRMCPRTGWAGGFGIATRPLARLFGPVAGEKMAFRARTLLGRSGARGTGM